MNSHKLDKDMSHQFILKETQMTLNYIKTASTACIKKCKWKRGWDAIFYLWLWQNPKVDDTQLVKLCGNRLDTYCCYIRVRIPSSYKNKQGAGRALWPTPVIPALWEAEAGRSPEVRRWSSAWPTWWNPVSTKSTNISRAWWHMPVVPATWEAETGESLEPGKRRLCCCTPAWVTEQDSVSKKPRQTEKRPAGHSGSHL